MNSRNDSVSRSAEADLDATLRLIASLPAPEGLEDRVHAALHSAPRTARILEWPAALSVGGAWMRGTAMRGVAAAAIVCVVAGGGWGIYSRVQPSRVVAMPQHIAAPGGFSNAGAMRTPQTLNRPVVNPATAPAHAKGSGRTVPAPIHRRQASAQATPAIKPSAPPAN